MRYYTFLKFKLSPSSISSHGRTRVMTAWYEGCWHATRTNMLERWIISGILHNTMTTFLPNQLRFEARKAHLRICCITWITLAALIALKAEASQVKQLRQESTEKGKYKPASDRKEGQLIPNYLWIIWLKPRVEKKAEDPNIILSTTSLGLLKPAWLSNNSIAVLFPLFMKTLFLEDVLTGKQGVLTGLSAPTSCTVEIWLPCKAGRVSCSTCATVGA